jgi:hypothetical protein
MCVYFKKWGRPSLLLVMVMIQDSCNRSEIGNMFPFLKRSEHYISRPRAELEAKPFFHVVG